MSVTINFRVDVRPYTGYEDPSLPIAAYFAQGGVAGSASGGGVFMTFRFQGAEVLPDQISEIYNLEQLSADTSTTVPRNLEVASLNMDALSFARPGSPQKWQLRTETSQDNASALPLETATGLPIWLGSPNQDAVSGDAGVRITWQDNIDLLLYAVSIQGYIWGPRAVLAPGGPRRPIGGLFR